MKSYYQKRFSARKYLYCPKCGYEQKLTRYARPGEVTSWAPCPACGSGQCTPRPVAPRDRCIQCRKPLNDQDRCPSCGARQGHILEFRTIHPEHLTEHALLLFHAGKGLSMKECRAICRRMSPDVTYRMHIRKLTNDVRQLMADWNALGGSVARCNDHETSRRPYVELRSFDHMKRWQYVHLLMRYHEMCNCRIKRDHRMTEDEAQAILTRINDQHEAMRHFAVPIHVTGSAEQLDALILAWEQLGGKAQRNPEYESNVIELCAYRQDRLDDCRALLLQSFGMTERHVDSVLRTVYRIDRVGKNSLVTFRFRDHLELIDSFIAQWRAIGGVAVQSERHEVS